MGVGFTKASAEKAINVLLKACPLEILREHSYLIVPSTEKKIISFAFNINNSEAIIIKRNENYYYYNFNNFNNSFSYGLHSL